MKEYVVLVSLRDPTFARVLKDVRAGTIKQLNVGQADKPESQNALAKSVSVPQPVDNSGFIRSLTDE